MFGPGMPKLPGIVFQPHRGRVLLPVRGPHRMPDDLQHLIERIQRDGVAKAESEAAEIVAAAKQKAAALLKAAETEAQARLKQADTDAAVFVERGRTALGQAARDVLLAVGGGLDALLDEVVNRAVGEALDPGTLRALLRKAVEAYAAKGLADGSLTVLLSPEDQQRLGDAVQAELRAAAGRGVSVRLDERLGGGFRLAVREGRLEYDFSRAALAEAVAALLKPELAAIVSRAAQRVNDRPA